MDSSMVAEGKLSYEERVSRCNPIAHPMSSEKTLIRIKKLIKKASKDVKGNILYGQKSVTTGLRRNAKGIVFISGDVQQIDTIAHIPGVCEEKDIPYIYVTCPSELSGGKIQRTPMMLVKPNEEYQEYYDKVIADIKKT